MHVSSSHPEPLAAIRALVADLERATPPRVVLAGLIDAATRLRLRLRLGEGSSAELRHLISGRRRRRRRARP